MNTFSVHWEWQQKKDIFLLLILFFILKNENIHIFYMQREHKFI